MDTILNGFLEPKSIAVIGASEDTQKPGGKIVENLLSKNYKGKLFLINPKSSTIQNKQAIPSISNLLETPDLVYIAIPAQFVAQTLLELAQIQAKRIIILSAGFGEINEKGRQIEKHLTEIANQNHMILLGPNCLGVMSPTHAGKFAGILPEMKKGGVDFVSGSGATVDILAEQAVRRGLSFNSFITVGNSAQIGVTDVLAFMDNEHNNESSKHILLYMEKVGDPAKLLQHAKSLGQKGCIIGVVKSGVSEDGQRAASSHTGAMAAKDTAIQALFEKAGLVRLSSKLEMVDFATALNLAKGKYNGKTACVITDAGGPGVMTTDELSRSGLSTPVLKIQTKKRLAELLPKGAGINNPIDMLPTRTPEQLAEVIKIIIKNEKDSIDYILIQMGSPGFSDNWPLYQVIAKAMDESPIPIFPSFSTSVSAESALKKYRSLGKCHFEDEVSMARAIGRMVNRPIVMPQAIAPKDYQGTKAAELLKNIKGMVPQDLAKKVFEACGIPLPKQQILQKPQDLDGLKNSLTQPWVLKVIGPVHKTELGGVIENTTTENLTQAYEKLMKIKGAKGVLAQETLKGPEVIMGLSREGEFGHLVAFGLGGVLAEALSDVKFALAPLSLKAAKQLIKSIKGLSIIKGYRGQQGMEIDALADILVKISCLAKDVPKIREMDINPIMGCRDKLFAVDVRIIME